MTRQMTKQELKTVKISDETHALIVSCGSMTESMDKVINRVFTHYIKEMKGKK